MTATQEPVEVAEPLDIAPVELADSRTGMAATPSVRVDRTGLLLAAAGAVAFSGKAIIVKLSYRHGVDAVTLLALRMAVALPFFLAMGAWAARRAPKLAAGDRLRVAALGFLGYYLSSFLDFAGLAYISATLERLILYLTPTLVMLLGVLASKPRPGRWQLLALAVSYAGVLLAFGHDFSLGGRNVALGSVLVFASALSYAMYLFGSGEIVARIGAVRLTAYASSVASVLCIAQFLLLRPLEVAAIPAPVWWLGLLNGTLCTVLPVLAVMMAVKRIGSAMAAQVGMLGPVSTIVLSLWLLHEPMGPWQVAGTVLVVLGVFALTRAKTS